MGSLMTCRNPQPVLIMTLGGKRVVCSNCDYLVLLDEVDSFRELIEARDAHLEPAS